MGRSADARESATDSPLSAEAALERERRLREAAERELRTTTALLETALGESLSGVIVAEAPDVSIRTMNAIAREILGAAEEGLDATAWWRSGVWENGRLDGSPSPEGEEPLARAVLRGEATRGARLRVRRADGEERQVIANATPVRDDSGAVVAGVVVFSDVTAEPAPDEDALEGATRVAAMLRAAPVGIVLTANRTVVDVNDRFLEMLGRAREEVIGSGAAAFYADDREARRIGLDMYAQLAQTGVSNVETRYVRSDGRVLDVLLRSFPLRPEDLSGEIVTAVLDITDRKAAEASLAAERNLLRTLIDHLPHEVFVKDRASRFIEANMEVLRRAGLSAEELLGKSDFDLMDADRAALHYEEEQRLMATGEGFLNREYNAVRGGQERRLRGAKLPLRDENGDVIGLVGFNLDITEQHELLCAAEENEARFRSLVQELPLGLFVFGPAGLKYANPAGLAMFGVDNLQSVLGRDVLESVHPDDRPHLTERAKAALEAGESTPLIPASCIRRDGSVFHVAVKSIPCVWEGEVSALSILIDSTDLEQAQRALRTAEREKAAILDAISDEVVYLDPEMRIVWANRAYGERQRSEDGADPGRSSPHCNAIEDGVCPVRQVLDTGSPQIAEVHRADGRRWLVGAYPVLDDDGALRGVVEVARDITDQRKAEESLGRAQRLESIGVLAGGIAHDFNNILSVICGFTDLVASSLAAESQEKAWLDNVLAAGDRARDLVRQILTFSRKTAAETMPLELAPIVKEVAKFIRASLPSTISIEIDVDPACRMVLADPTQMHQVLMNLCTNAAQAMGQASGVLEIRLQEAEVDDALARRIRNLNPGTYARLTVSDTGQGMDKETVARIFEPFFSTKAPGEGTGLGLSTVHGIVMTHGGAITVYSEPNVGSTFHVYLPLCEYDLDQPAQPAAEPPSGTGRILLVDDEQALLMMTTEILTGLGYAVSGFVDSREALRAFLEGPEDFDIVVTDQTMPNLTGAQLAATVRFERPDIPIIIVTGYTQHVETHSVETLGLSAVILKPFTRHELASAIRNALDERAAMA